MSWSWQTHRNRSFRSHLRQPERSLNHFSIFQVFSSPNWSPHHRFNPPHDIAHFVLVMMVMMMMIMMIKPTSKMMSSSSSSVKSSSTSFKMVLNLSTGMNPSPSMSNNLDGKLSYSWSLFELHGIDEVQKIEWHVAGIFISNYQLLARQATIKKPPAHPRDWQDYKSQDLSITINYSCRQERRERWQK